ncbi:hypothetical protein HAX54_006326, partial [Datura stramonium]|nr:hypothetical protein [Datura stramonium]
QTTSCRNCPLWSSPPHGFKTRLQGRAQTTSCRNCPLWGSPPHGFKTRLQGR